MNNLSKVHFIVEIDHFNSLKKSNILGLHDAMIYMNNKNRKENKCT